jgi:hypothetical protein
LLIKSVLPPLQGDSWLEDLHLWKSMLSCPVDVWVMMEA